MEKQKHTEGPWRERTVLKQPENTREYNVIAGKDSPIARFWSDDDRARSIRSVNGCDDAGVVEPLNLPDLFNALKSAPDEMLTPEGW